MGIKRFIKKSITIFLIYLMAMQSVFATSFLPQEVRNPLDQRAPIDERVPLDVRYNIDVEMYNRTIHERFGHFVGDIFTISIENESDINSIISIDGHYFDLAPIIKNFAIGATVIISIVALPYVVVPVTAGATAVGATSTVAVFATAVASGASKVALAAASTAAIDAGINGVMRYIETDGNWSSAGYAALQGAGQGFKWGAIVAGVGDVANSAIFVAKHGAEYVVTRAGVSKGAYQLQLKNEVPVLPTRNMNVTNTSSSRHPKTNVPFGNRVIETAEGVKQGAFPKFPSVYKCKISPSEFMGDRPMQYKAACKILKQEIARNPRLKAQFTLDQLSCISNYEKTNGIIPGYTWHHNEEAGIMELVLESTHALTGHTGGYSIWCNI